MAIRTFSHVHTEIRKKIDPTDSTIEEVYTLPSKILRTHAWFPYKITFFGTQKHILSMSFHCNRECCTLQSYLEYLWKLLHLDKLSDVPKKNEQYTDVTRNILFNQTVEIWHRVEMDIYTSLQTIF